MDERDVETIQHVENLTPGDTRTDAIGWFRARSRHARKWQVKEASRGERKVILVKWDAWQHMIGRPDFYLILSLNSIISLQINFLFFYFFIFIPRFMIFFLCPNQMNQVSIYREKKNEFWYKNKKLKK
jgi:hypothetical protein